MTDVDLPDLRLLVLVAEVGSIGRAAQQLAIPQPTISRRLSRLERRWGLDLLRRSPRGTELTPTGQVVVDWATALLKRVEDFQQSVDALRESRTSTLRVAASMTIAEQYAPGWIRAVSRRDPHSTISLTVRNSAGVTRLVEGGEVDLGFVESLFVAPRLHRRQVAYDRLAIAVTPGHPWAQPGFVLSTAELSRTPLLLREEGSGTRETMEEALRRFGLGLTPLMEIASNAALKAAAVAGMGPVVLSRTSLAPEIAAGQLVPVEVAGVTLRRPLTAIWVSDDRLNAVAHALIASAAGS